MQLHYHSSFPILETPFRCEVYERLTGWISEPIPLPIIPTPISSFFNLCMILNKKLSMPNDPHTLFGTMWPIMLTVEGYGAPDQMVIKIVSLKYYPRALFLAFFSIHHILPWQMSVTCLHTHHASRLLNSSTFFIYHNSHYCLSCYNLLKCYVYQLVSISAARI